MALMTVSGLAIAHPSVVCVACVVCVAWLVRLVRASERRSASTRALLLQVVAMVVLGAAVVAAEGIPVPDPCESCSHVWPEWVCRYVMGCW